MADNSFNGLVSGIRIKDAVYPDGNDAYSPSDDFPELTFSHRSSRPNSIYRGVRQCLANAKLDTERFGTPEWNPFSQYLTPGGRVFILCNFVYERRPKESLEAFRGKCTHASVIRPIIDYALKAVGPKGKVEFGNAPLQSANWNSILKDTGAVHLLKFYETYAPGQVSSCDLRSHIIVQNKLGWRSSQKTRLNHKVFIDLSKKSLLEQINGNHSYRVSQYNPRETTEFQGDGIHIYALNSKILSADLIISIPKLKTHEKVGITCALKGCVGAVALKQSLAHHRKGSPKSGGDEFPSYRPVQSLVSKFSDWTWSQSETRITNLERVAEKLAIVVIRQAGGITFGSWPGNDTCWRMALDVARCVAHAMPDGTLTEGFVRKHLVLTDGIIAGEGEGPLSPKPVSFGWLFFASDPFAADYINCLAMGFAPNIIPLVGAAPYITDYPVTNLKVADVRLSVNGEDVSPAFLIKATKEKFRPPQNWRGIENSLGNEVKDW